MKKAEGFAGQPADRDPLERCPSTPSRFSGTRPLVRRGCTTGIAATVKARKATLLKEDKEGKKQEWLVMGGPEAGANPKEPLVSALKKELLRLEELQRCAMFEVPSCCFVEAGAGRARCWSGRHGGGGGGWGATTGLRERGNDISKSTGRSGRQQVATRRNMRREERVTVQGPVKEQQPDRMSHGGGGWGAGLLLITQHRWGWGGGGTPPTPPHP